MKKFIASALFILLITLPFLTACKPASSGGEVLSSDFKLVAEKEAPSSGNPNDYSPLENLAFAAYKFNRASSWESLYTGEVIAIGTKQRVENTRQFDNGILFAQAISVSNVKTVAEQKYYRGDNILYRPYVKLDKTTLKTSWSNSIKSLPRDEYFKNYGLIPNEIFKYVIDETTVLSAEKLQSDNFAFKFELSTDCTQYLKNEVRTLAGSKSDPEYISIECTIEMDNNWNVIRTTAKEKYKVAIMGGVTCDSTSTEVFTVGQKVDIIDKAIFEAYAPGGDNGSIEQPKQPIDYLTLAFSNLSQGGMVNLEAMIGDLKAIINFDTDTGLFAIKLGDTVIKNTGEYIYVLGETNVKFKALSLYETIYFIIDRLPTDLSDSMPINAPEIEALIGEVTAMLSGEESDESNGNESMINRILDGMDMATTESGATITINFALDGIKFDVELVVVNDTLDCLNGDITFEGKTLHMSLSPTTQIINADNSSASDISELLEAISATINSGLISLESGDFVVSISLDGTVYITSEMINVRYQDQVIYADIMGKKLSADLSVFDIAMPQLEIRDIINAVSALKSLPLDASITAAQNELALSFTYNQTKINATLKAIDGKLNITLNAGDMTFVSTDKIAMVEVNGEYVKIDNLIMLANNIANAGSLDMRLDAEVGTIRPSIDLTLDFTDRYLVAKAEQFTMQLSDAIYIATDSVKGKISYESISMDNIELPSSSIDIKELLSILTDTELYNDGDSLVIEYAGLIGDANIEVTIYITDTFDINGKVTINDNSYTLHLTSGNKVEQIITDDFILLDPIVYFARDFMSSSPTFEVRLSADKFTVNAFVMPDLNNKGVALKIGNSYLYAYDKLYFQNLNGKYSFTYDSVIDALSQIGLEADFDINEIISDLLNGENGLNDFTIKQSQDTLTIAAKIKDIDMEISFDYVTNYLKNIKISSEKFEAQINPTNLAPLPLPQSFDGYKDVDFVTELVSPIKQLTEQKQFTFTLNNFEFENFSLSGSVAVNLLSDLELDINLTFIKDAKHNLKATLRGNNVTAVYNDTLKVTLTKDTLLTILFKVTDIIGLKADLLEQYRPEGSSETKSDIIYNALPQEFVDNIKELNELISQGITINKILEYIDTLEIGGRSGNIALTLHTDSPITLTVAYDSRISGIALSTDKACGNIKIDYYSQHITVPSGAYNFNFDSFDELTDYSLNTVNLGQYNVSGKINLNMINIINVDIPFVLKAKILNNNKPLVYVKLDVPNMGTSVIPLLTRAYSYIFYYDNMMYLKSERYSVSIIGTTKYSHTEYIECTPEEFADNLIDYLFFLVPLSNSIQSQIKDSMQSSEKQLDFTNALTYYSFDGKAFDITVDLKALTGNSNLGNVDLKLTSDGTKIYKFDITMGLISIITLNFDATLNSYNGEIEYGVNEDGRTSDITQMGSIIPSLKRW
ncbi:MAG: hypothetical protein J1F36_04730 [Clostridiales bacterium]|nr:hypothetical protein [Clostridiales bacterium]